MKTDNMGFSFIELILYIALLLIVIGSMTTFGVSSILLRAKNRVEQEVIANTRLVAKRLNYEVRNAAAISSVGAQSISLTNTDTTRNPTVISKSGGRITIGWGSTGNCPTTSPCYLTSKDVTVQSLIFADVSSGTSPESVKYEIAVKGESSLGSRTYSYKEYATGSAQIRGK